jgi:Ulp1 family protease
MEFYDRAKYMKALLDDSRKDRTERMRIARRTRSGGNKKRNNADNKLILVYPFDAKETELSAAASGLKELGGDLLGLDRAHARSVQGQLDEANTTERMKKPSRTHYVTIRDDDKERLCPGQFLNDTLVDFWMRW